MKLRVVCLSVPRCVERRARFEAEARRLGLAFSYSDGPDTRALAPSHLMSLADQDRAVVRFGRRLAPSEIACAEGHRQIYRSLVESDDDAAVIFEDDVRLDDRIVEVLDGLRGLQGEIAGRKEVFHLGGRDGYEDYPLMVSRRTPTIVTPAHRLLRVVRSDRALQRACSYVITRAAAAAILEKEQVISLNPDPWDVLLKEKTIDQIWVLEPPVGFHDLNPADSLLTPERLAIEAGMMPRRGGWPDTLRRAARVTVSPRRLVRSVAYRLGWQRVKRVAYAVLSRMA